MDLWLPFAATFTLGEKEATLFCIAKGCTPALALGPSLHCSLCSLLWAPGNSPIASVASTPLCLKGWDRYFLPWFVVPLITAKFLSIIVAGCSQINMVRGSSVPDLYLMDQSDPAYRSGEQISFLDLHYLIQVDVLYCSWKGSLLMMENMFCSSPWVPTLWKERFSSQSRSELAFLWCSSNAKLTLICTDCEIWLVRFSSMTLKGSGWWLAQIQRSTVAVCSVWDESHTRIRARGRNDKVSSGMLDYIPYGKSAFILHLY